MKHFGWGREGEAMTAEEESFIVDRCRRRFSVDRFDQKAPPMLQDLKLPGPRIAPPASLASFCSSDAQDRCRAQNLEHH
jgi:alkyldihydroxyacetonephosphate synthase